MSDGTRPGALGRAIAVRRGTTIGLVKPLRVLLTGAAGFIGSATAGALAAAGHEVIGVDALIPQAHARPAAAPRTATLAAGSPARTPPGVHLLDLRDAHTWPDVLRGVDVVCHLAAMVGAGLTVADLPAYAGHNDLGTASLLRAMHEAGVHRLVQASSMVVYGEGRYTCPLHGPQQPGPRDPADLVAGRFENVCPVCDRTLDWALVDESATVDPRSSYAASKLAQEHYAAAWARQAPGVAVSLRYHNVYGRGMPRDTPYSGVAAIFRSAVEAGRTPEVFEDGGQMRDFVHVDDVAAANVIAVDAVSASLPRVEGPHDPNAHRVGSHTAYNICSGRPVSVLDVAREVARGLGSDAEPVVSGRFRLGDVRHVVASPERARARLGFVAQVSPEEGLPRFVTEPLRG